MIPADLQLSLAKVRLATHQPGALAAVVSGLNNDPWHLGCLVLKARLENEAGNSREAIQDAEVAIAVDPCCANAYAQRGAARQGLHNFSAAISDFDHAARLEPALASAMQAARGGARLGAGDAEGAIVDFDEAVARGIPPETIGYRRATALFASGRYHDARSALDAEVNAAPDSVAAHIDRGLVMRTIGERALAATDFNFAIERGWSAGAWLLYVTSAEHDGGVVARQRLRENVERFCHYRRPDIIDTVARVLLGEMSFAEGQRVPGTRLLCTEGCSLDLSLNLRAWAAYGLHFAGDPGAPACLRKAARACNATTMAYQVFQLDAARWEDQSRSS